MQQRPITSAQKNRIEGFLKGYSTNFKLLRLAKYEEEFFGGGRLSEGDTVTPSEGPLAKARMYEVRHFVLSLDNSDEKLLLYYHYIKGESVQRCAELLGISRRTAFRLKARALSLAYERAQQQNILEDSTKK